MAADTDGLDESVSLFIDDVEGRYVLMALAELLFADVTDVVAVAGGVTDSSGVNVWKNTVGVLTAVDSAEGEADADAYPVTVPGFEGAAVAVDCADPVGSVDDETVLMSVEEDECVTN